MTSSDEITKLSRELVSINTTGNTGELHFKAPSLSSSTNTDFYIYYGYSSATETNDTTTWNSNYKAVYHLQESSGSVLDSTVNSNNGTNNGATTQVTGKIEKGYDFEDTENDHISLGTSFADFGTNDITMSAWIKPETVPTTGLGDGIIGYYGSTAYTYVRLHSNQKLELVTDFGSGQIITPSDNTLSVGNWYNVVVVLDRNGNQTIYVNGLAQSSPTDISSYSAVSLTNSNEFDIGNVGSNLAGWYFDGIIDEVRVLYSAISSNEVSSIYNNQSSPSTFYSVGTQEQSIITQTLNESGIITETLTKVIRKTLTENVITSDTEILPKIMISKSIDLNNGTITTATIEITSLNQPSNVFLSADGGIHWEKVTLTSVDGVFTGTINFVNTGTDLRWKILDSNNEISNLEISNYH